MSPSSLHITTKPHSISVSSLKPASGGEFQEDSGRFANLNLQPMPQQAKAHLQVQHSAEERSLASSWTPVVSLLTALGGAAFAMAHLRHRADSQIAIAPFFGIVQPTNQTVADVRSSSSSTKTDKGADSSEDSMDRETERHRIDQRVVFNAERWRKHRGIDRYGRAVGTTLQSYVVRHLVWPVFGISLFAAGVCAAQLAYGVDQFSLPTSLFSLSAPTLGLLLVFRTNASYERWDGARKMIGLVKNRSEDLTRQVCLRFPADRTDLKEQMMRYIHAFFFALKVHLRSGPGGFEDDSNLIEDLTPVLKSKELELLLKATNRPAHVMHCMTEIVKAAKLEGAALYCLDQNITQLADVLGGCERILRTPIPLSYTRMLTRFLLVFLLLLPLALSVEVLKLDHSIWLTIPAVSFISFALLGIEEVAVQIEEPFSILPMEAYAEGSRRNTTTIFDQMAAVASMNIVEKAAPPSLPSSPVPSQAEPAKPVLAVAAAATAVPPAAPSTVAVVTAAPVAVTTAAAATTVVAAAPPSPAPAKAEPSTAKGRTAVAVAVQEVTQVEAVVEKHAVVSEHAASGQHEAARKSVVHVAAAPAETPLPVPVSQPQAQKAESSNIARYEPSPKEVVLELQRGNGRFWMGVSERNEMNAMERRSLIVAQYPKVCILSCSDSRVPVEIIFDQGLGDVFVVRMAGNVLNASAAGSIEYAVKFLGVKVLLVIGHEGCGAVKGAITMSPTDIAKEPSDLQEVLRSIRADLDVKALDDISDVRAREREAIVNNTMNQVQRLQSNPLIAPQVEKGQLLVVGAFYEISSGIVDFFSLDKNGFLVDV
eukprot:EG_transcript_2357